MSDTPRTSALLVAWDMSPSVKALIHHAQELEKELSTAILNETLATNELHKAKERIKRLEDAGEKMLEATVLCGFDEFTQFRRTWNQAKEQPL